jgi:neutral amino acid transport system permease protein
VAKRVVLLLAAVVSTLGFVLIAGAGPALAVGESIFGFIRNPEGKGDARELVPVEGVKVTVTGPGGFSGTATSDADGRWSVDLPGPGAYTVKLDTGTLPEGVTLTDEERATLQTPVAEGQDKPVLFGLGESTRQVQSDWERAAQLTAEGLRFGLIIALAAVGLSLIFGTTGLTNFAHGELVTFGAIVTWWLTIGVLPFAPEWTGVPFLSDHAPPFLVASVIGLILCGLFGWANDAVLWKPLRRRGTGLIAAMIVSIGLAIFLRYFYLWRVTGNTRSFTAAQGQEGIDIGPITLGAYDYISMGVAVVVLGAVAFALLRTRVGKATRAVDGVIRVVWISGAVLAGLAGILLGLAQGVNFQMGFQILLLIFAAVTLGGLGTAFGALVGSLVVGVVVSVSTLWIPVELKNVAALGILILILLVRPQGILGRAERVG